MAVMPMFPLGTPLLPGAVIPLHVFEPRYRQMVRDLLADDDDPPEFGVVMIERGREVGGGDERSTIGTVARVVDIEVTPDGRYAIAAVGVERLRVVAWLPDDPYPLADVDRWPDDDTGAVLTADTIEALHVRVREINVLVRDLGDIAPPPDIEISDDPQLALFHLAALSPLGAADRQRILAAPGSAERVVALREALDDAAAVLEFRRT
ncbi:MAG TPA: LON peptidase substrate-binding domain-containing protein [Ilumatobacter sp.]|nr:LON peptidase substrate-binding domain-containing protein [Ilumatobacter sp.]